MRVRRTALGGRFATHRSLVPRQRLQPIAASYLVAATGTSIPYATHLRSPVKLIVSQRAASGLPNPVDISSRSPSRVATLSIG